MSAGCGGRSFAIKLLASLTDGVVQFRDGIYARTGQ